MPTSVDVVVEPLDEIHCQFVATVPVPGESRTYRTPGDAAGSPVAQAVLEVPGVAEVAVAGNVLTARKDPQSPPWRVLGDQVRYAIGSVLANLQADTAPAPPASPLDDDSIFDRASLVFQREINPGVAQHGGQVELIDVQDGVVLLRMSGGCQGCGMARVTLRQGVESALRRAVPSLRGIRDITDHASGQNPYFKPAQG